MGLFLLPFFLLPLSFPLSFFFYLPFPLLSPPVPFFPLFLLLFLREVTLLNIFHNMQRMIRLPKMGLLQHAALALSLVSLCSMSAHGAVRMPKFFSDGLVLQTNSQSGVRRSRSLSRAALPRFLQFINAKTYDFYCDHSAF